MTIKVIGKLFIVLSLHLSTSCSQLPSETSTPAEPHSLSPVETSRINSYIYSDSMKKDMSFSVYTPPGWTPDESLPLVFLLHGARDDHMSFYRYEVDVFLDSLYKTNSLPRVIIINPNGDLGFWENWKDGTHMYRDWVLDDLFPYIQNTFQTQPCPKFCFITGVSMGAHGAMRFVYYEPELFSSVAAISALILSRQNAKPTFWQRIMMSFIPVKRIWGDINKRPNPERRKLDPFNSWINNKKLEHTRLFLSWGDKDKKSILKTNEKFQAHLAKNKRLHTFEVYEGKHLWIDWKEPIAQSIRFHMSGNID